MSQHSDDARASAIDGASPPAAASDGESAPSAASEPRRVRVTQPRAAVDDPTEAKRVSRPFISPRASLSSSFADGSMLGHERHMAVTNSSPAIVVPTPSHPGAAALEAFTTASKQLIKGRDLLIRTDVKFFGLDTILDEVLPLLAAHYAVIRVPSGCAANYQSVYFDTPDLRCYHDHRRGRRIRHKVRIRHYPDRQLSYLELKKKMNARVTDKLRLALPYGQTELSVLGREFLAQHCDLPVEQLEPTLTNHFRRISLIGIERAERVTIDVDLGFDHRGLSGGFDGLTVIEVKQHPYDPHSPIMAALHAAGMRERSMSKYTTAIARLAPGIARNRLLPLLRALDRTKA